MSEESMGDKELTTFCMTPTPYREDGLLDEEALRVHPRRPVAARTGLFLCSGGAGEAHVLTPKGMGRIYKIGVEEAKGKVPVYAGGLAKSAVTPLRAANHIATNHFNPS